MRWKKQKSVIKEEKTKMTRKKERKKERKETPMRRKKERKTILFSRKTD